MRKKPRKSKSLKKKKMKTGVSQASILNYHTELIHTKKTMQRLTDSLEKMDERLSDLEIHVNLVTRLLTTICVEKLGIRVGVLKRLIKRIEKEAIRDSQILHLEELYKLPSHSGKKEPPPQSSSKNDPWEDIS